MRIPIYFLFLISAGHVLSAQTLPWSERMAAAAMKRWGTGNPSKWTYEKGLILKSVEKVWERNPDVKYYQYIQNNIDYFVTAAGTINTYDPAEYNIDNINMGRSLLFLYNRTAIEKYKTAAIKVKSQLLTHPRTTEGGFWHKKVYPNQMWLDGLYMGEPFYAEFSQLFNEPSSFDDIASQIILMEKHARDPLTGLLYHGWDESREQLWSDPLTGCSPNFWGRAMGWYAMSLVDVLDYFPQDHNKHDTIVNILNRLSKAVIKYQDHNSGLWYQVVDKGGLTDNYEEASASCMLVYALAKGARKGYLGQEAMDAALTGYEGILQSFIAVDAQSVPHLNQICRVAGLGGNPYRDGSYEYYLSEPVVQDDPKGVGAFILASVEIEMAKEKVTAINASEELAVYIGPNPVLDVLHVIVAQGNSLSFTIFNSQGKEVLSGNSFPIPLTDFSNGIYYLEIMDGEKRAFKKFVKSFH